MANDVVLGAALRTNLLSLQSTQRSIDVTQLRLATGKKVNSALDNPQNFFTSQSLSNRASDLTRLLDGIGQSIKTIQAADKGITALTKLVEQASSVVSSARDELAATSGTARISGTVDLRTFADLTAAPFAAAGIANNDVVQITTTNDAGAQIIENIVITTGDTAYTLAAKITDQFADARAGEITASINSSTGVLQIESKGGRSFRIGDAAAGTAVTTAGYTALGLGRFFEDQTVGANTLSSTTVIAGNTARSISLFESPGNTVDAGDFISGQTYTNANGVAVIAGVVAADNITFQINNGAATPAIALTATTTFQDVVDQVNANTTYNTQIRLGFDSLTGQFTVTSLSDAVENVSVNFVSTTAAAGKLFNLGLGDTSGNLNPLNPVTAATYEQVLTFNSSTQTLDKLATDYNTVRTQINDLVKDASYRGVNLLNGDNLTTFFNEDNSSRLTSTGATFTSDGLGLTAANFSSATAIENTATRTRDALNNVRSFGSSLANNLSIIQTRQTFTQEIINTLKAGSAELTDADSNEEGANLLALQTRQQLGVTSLSLASQSQQSVLRLF